MLHQPTRPRSLLPPIVRFAVSSALALGCASETTAPDASAPDASAPDASAPDASARDVPTEASTDAQALNDTGAVSQGDSGTDAMSLMDVSLAPDVSTPDILAVTDVPLFTDISVPMDVPVPMDAVGCGMSPTPPADPDPWAVGVPSVGPAVTRMVTSGGHQDVYLTGPGGVAEFAVRLDWGGSVVFFGQAGMPGSNTIDANDTGREVQLALYDPARAAQGCAYNASCAGPGPCPGSISYLGWDPVQGGDRCGHGTPILSNVTLRDTVTVTVNPLQWNPSWDAPTCAQPPCGSSGVPTGVHYVLGYRFVHPNVVEIAMEVSSTESLDHRPSNQEFPTMYVGHGGPSTDLPVLLDPTGHPIAITLPGNDGFTHQEFTTTAPWVTWQHSAQDYGVGLVMDNGITTWQGWQGDGVHAPYFHNVRAIQSFGLPPLGTVRGRAFLILGSFSTVQSLARSILAERPPFGVLDTPYGVTLVPTAGVVPLGGWVLDNAPGVSVIPRLDGHDLAAIPVTTSRPDVCTVYPNYRGCPSPGFDARVTVPVSDTCPHTLDVIARDSDGNETRLGTRIVQAP